MQTMNMFSQEPVQGQLDLRMNTNIIAAQIDASEATLLVPGQAVTLVNSVGGVPKVIAALADSDDIYGFIAYDIKDKTFKALDAVEIAALRDNCMYMMSSAAIARGASVSVVIASKKVLTSATGMRIVGKAFDAATGTDQLIRVVIELFGILAP